MKKSVANTILAWTPGTDKVALFPFGDIPGEYTSTGLGAYTKMREGSFLERKAYAFIEAVHLIVRDGCDPIAVHNALIELEEYRDGCAEDMAKVFDCHQAVSEISPF